MTAVRYHGQPLGLNIFFNCVFILLCLVLLNAGLRRVAPRWSLDRRELLVIYIMLNIASAVIPRIFILSPAMSLWSRYATPANKWEELFFRYIPQWLYFGDDNIIRGLYEGGDSLYRVPYLVAWVPRILSWSAFIGVQAELVFFPQRHQDCPNPLTAQRIRHPHYGYLRDRWSSCCCSSGRWGCRGGSQCHFSCSIF